jgi:hypothetical protein
MPRWCIAGSKGRVRRLAPGAEPRWTSSEKDVASTAYATSSKLWWTVSHGIVNELYYPTIDRPQVRDLELMITDGETFVHEEKRDLDYTRTTSPRKERNGAGPAYGRGHAAAVSACRVRQAAPLGGRRPCLRPRFGSGGAVWSGGPGWQRVCATGGETGH